MKPSGIGGQAVLEGVMMKNGDRYAVAVRKPDHEIEVMESEYKGITSGRKIISLPFIRGVFNFIDSMILGIKTITYSASFFEDEEETDKKSSEKSDKLLMSVTVLISMVLAVAIFMVLPVLIANLFRRFVSSSFLMALVEGVIRIAIFIGYVALISRMEDIRRVFMYHGAEHKCINCIEHGKELTVENVRSSSRQHKRCGTSFLLLVMIISIFFTLFVRVDTLILRVISRVLLIPIIAGVSYEVLRLAGRSESRLVNLISKPGLALQKLTTSEPDDEMIEVAIRSVEAVFDWRAFIHENGPVQS